jgi:hypothetical protein
MCQNTTIKNNCYPSEKIINDLNEIFAHFIYLDNFVDVKDNIQPIKYLINGDILQGSILSVRTEEYSYKNVEVISDSGWIINDITNYESFQMSHKSTFSKNNIDMNTYFYNIIVTLIHTKEVTIRRYIKLQEIFANVGGIIKFFVLFLSFINEYFSRIMMIECLMLKSLTGTSSDKNKDKKNPGLNNINRKQLKIPIFRNIQNSKFQSSSVLIFTNPKLNNINNKEKNKKQIDISNYQKIKYRELFCFNTCTKNSRSMKVKVINKFEQIMTKKLDIQKLLKVFDDIKIINKVLFSDKINHVKNHFIKEINIRNIENDIEKQKKEKIDVAKILADIKNKKLEINEFESKLFKLI